MASHLPSSQSNDASFHEIISYNAPVSMNGGGSCPSGTMKIELLQDTACPGFDCPTIQITYHIPSGKQQKHHMNPRKSFPETERIAYLPDNEQGRNLLMRLKYAWSQGLTFNIGTSLTTGQSNVVTWTTILHKTSLHGGLYGWPDPAYLQNCGDALDTLRVPDQPIHLAHHKHSIHYAAPTATLATSSRGLSGALEPQLLLAVGECPICLDDLHQENDQPPVQIQGCKHTFHKPCIEQSLNREPRCPMCRKPVGEPHGHSPSGKLTIELSPKSCPGFSSAKAISLTYEIPSGTQLPYHPSPGTHYSGTTRTGYLPDNDDGLRLLTRLQYAWKHGLTFTIGTSLTTGQSNCVTWTSIHHKTSLHGGPHGFPDASYIANCNGSLDALHVPNADACF